MFNHLFQTFALESHKQFFGFHKSPEPHQGTDLYAEFIQKFLDPQHYPNFYQQPHATPDAQQLQSETSKMSAFLTFIFEAVLDSLKSQLAFYDKEEEEASQDESEVEKTVKQQKRLDINQIIYL